MIRRIVVAVDGPAGSGKSSVSKEVAVKLKLKYIDSGAIYRSITWFILSIYGEIPDDIDFFRELASFNLKQEFLPNGTSRTYVNGRDVSGLIRDEVIAGNIGVVSDNIDVRNFVNGLLRKMAEEESVIMDGRDIGTVVFPEAHIKIYLDASVDERARRRVKEYKEMGKNVDEIAVKKQIIQRDNEDRSRKYGALRKADDAVIIDTSGINKDRVVAIVESIIKKEYPQLCI